MVPPAASSTPSTPAESEAARLTATPEPVPAAVDTGSAGTGEEVYSPADALGSMSELNEALPTATTTTEGVVGGDAVEAAPPPAAAAGVEQAEGEDGDAESVGEEVRRVYVWRVCVCFYY